MENTQIMLNNLLVEYKVQIVGRGYGECIVKKENAIGFINELGKLKIKIKSVEWWCHCNARNKEVYCCPHGGGGPVSEYYDGYFSEMYHIPAKDIICNEEAVDYIFNGCRSVKFYSPCIEPSVCLDVPDEWKNSSGEDLMPLV